MGQTKSCVLCYHVCLICLAKMFININSVHFNVKMARFGEAFCEKSLFVCDDRNEKIKCTHVILRYTHMCSHICLLCVCVSGQCFVTFWVIPIKFLKCSIHCLPFCGILGVVSHVEKILIKTQHTYGCDFNQ